jgi:hypothetical protein
MRLPRADLATMSPAILADVAGHLEISREDLLHQLFD